MITSCSVTNIKYAEKRINKLENKGYTVSLNNESINFNKLLLNQENITEITKNSKEKIVNIQSKTISSDFISGEALYDQIKAEANQKFDLIVIKGLPIKEKDFKNLKIEKSIFKGFKFLTPQELNIIGSCKYWENGILLIELK